MKNKTETDKFEFFSDYVKVTSKSGNDYTITIDHCTCRGFSFHKTCRHFEQAQALGLIEKLKTQIVDQHDLSLSPNAIALRKDAIKKWLTKKQISFSDQIVDKIESILKSTSNPQEILAIATAKI